MRDPLKEKLCVLRQACEDFNAVLQAHEQGIRVVCGRCKAPITFVLKKEAMQQGVDCSASCSKDKSHVNITWRAQKREKSTPPWRINPMPKKILVADDERHIVQIAQAALERAGYDIITTENGKDALKKVELEKPDLVVLDYSLPDMDDFEVLKILLQNPATRHLPIIMLTRKAADEDVFRGWNGPVDYYLTKPFNPMELISFVKRKLSDQDSSDNEAGLRYTIG